MELKYHWLDMNRDGGRFWLASLEWLQAARAEAAIW